MKKKTTLSEEDQALFRQLMAGTRKIKQDTIVHRPQRKKISEVPVKRLIQEQADASHYFSDEFQPLLNTEGPVKYVRPDGNDSNLLIVFYVQIMPDDFVMQLHRF